MRFVETTALLPVRLMEHPGKNHDQKSHAGTGAGGSDLKGQQAKVDAELRTIRGAERVVAIDSSGKVVLDVGNAGTSVELSMKDDISMMGAVVTHNHPRGIEAPEGSLERNGNSFSPDDMMTAQRAGVAEMRVVTQTSTYSLKPGTDAQWGIMTKAKSDAMSDAAKADINVHNEAMSRVTTAGFVETTRQIGLATINAQVETAFWRDIQEGRKTPAQASAMHYDELTRRASAEFGWEYTVSHGPNWVDPVTFSESVADALERVLERVRLLEHPGTNHNQKSHGRKGTLGTAGGTDQLSASTRGKVEAQRVKLGVPTSADMAVRLSAAYDAASPSARKVGMTWYGDRNKEARVLGEANKQSLEQVSAAMAVLSPTRRWSNNLATAKEISRVTHEDKAFEVTAAMGAKAKPVKVAAGMYKPSDLSSRQVAFLHPELKNSVINDKYGLTGKDRNVGRNSTRQTATAVEVLRGDITPDQALTGVKTRNFYNNIYDPTDRGSVTIDDWAYKAALGDTHVSLAGGKDDAGNSLPRYEGPATGAPYGQIGNQMQTSPKVVAEDYKSGVYPVYADAYNLAAADAGILPQQLQAVVWESIRENTSP